MKKRRKLPNQKPFWPFFVCLNLLSVILVRQVEATTGLSGLEGLYYAYLFIVGLVGLVPLICMTIEFVRIAKLKPFSMLSLLWIIPTIVYLVMAYMLLVLCEDLLFKIILGSWLVFLTIILIVYFIKAGKQPRQQVTAEDITQGKPSFPYVATVAWYLIVSNLYFTITFTIRVLFNWGNVVFANEFGKICFYIGVGCSFSFLIGSVGLLMYREWGRKLVCITALMNMLIWFFTIPHSFNTYKWLYLVFSLGTYSLIYFILTRKKIRGQFSSS